jgi:hypothetical protein
MDLPILTTDEYLNLSTPTNKNECKGRYFRCQNKRFESKGTICQSIKFIPLKRQSCSGCDICNSIVEQLLEIEYKYICNNPKDGALYKLSITNVLIGYENECDDWNLEFVLV